MIVCFESAKGRVIENSERPVNQQRKESDRLHGSVVVKVLEQGQEQRLDVSELSKRHELEDQEDQSTHSGECGHLETLVVFGALSIAGDQVKGLAQEVEELAFGVYFVLHSQQSELKHTLLRKVVDHRYRVGNTRFVDPELEADRLDVCFQ